MLSLLSRCALLLIILILGFILWNAVLRVRFTYSEFEIKDAMKYVDLFAVDVKSIPVNAAPGMSILVDRGRRNLETGIYIVDKLDEKGNASLVKIAVPEQKEKYFIKWGEYAKHIHHVQEENIPLLHCRCENCIGLFSSDDDEGGKNNSLVLNSQWSIICVEQNYLKDIQIVIPKTRQLPFFQKLRIFKANNYSLHFFDEIKQYTVFSFVGITNQTIVVLQKDDSSDITILPINPSPQ